mgnify:CR=1 FL=1
MIDPDELLYQQVLKKLQSEDLSASEIEVCRKYLNDRASRGGSIHTTGHKAPEEATKSDWAGLQFEEVKVTRRHE